jgi:hypothetical protein
MAVNSDKVLIMKTLFLALLFACSVCSATTIEIAEAWMAPTALTENDIRFIDVLDCETIKGTQHVLVARAYLLIQTVYLGQLVSDEFQEYRWDKTESGPVTLLDFLLLPPTEFEDGTSEICLCSRDFNGSRRGYTTSDQLAIWMIGVAPFGYTDEDIYHTKLPIVESE